MKTIRQSIRQQRRDISASDRNRFAKDLLWQVQKLAKFKNGAKIALYLPNDGEIDTKYIQIYLKGKGFSIYLPVLSGKRLKFAKIADKFKKNRFGIKEPVSTDILDANQLNIIFMPLVGFDKFKNRIGMSGGFYDRTLAFKKTQTQYRNPLLYGLAFDCQMVNELNVQAWDIPLDAVITPTEIYE